MEPSGPISGFKGRVRPLGQQVVASQAHVSSVGKYMTTSKLTDGQFSKPHLLDSTQLPEVTGVTASILADREQLALAGARSRTQVGLFPMYDFLSAPLKVNPVQQHAGLQLMVHFPASLWFACVLETVSSPVSSPRGSAFQGLSSPLAHTTIPYTN